MNWRKRTGEEVFEHGDQILVAVPVVAAGVRMLYDKVPTKRRIYWEVSSLVVEADGGFSLRTIDDEPFDWDWADVEYWVPMREVTEDLPPAWSLSLRYLGTHDDAGNP